ncbi:MAG TPA: aldehyde dehydrogenase family protein [Thermoplasmata archaeon]|nr:aldehyde dehydrogenase family protein [Thermoplasmata archaeon]
MVDFRNERTWQNAVETGKTEEFHAAYEAAVDKVRSEFGGKHPMVIGAEDVWATSTFPDLSPANTKLVLGLFQKGTKAHAKAAIKAAREAYPTWAATPYMDRVRIFQRAADLIGQRRFPYAALMSFENGKNRYEAMADVDEAADLMRWYVAEMVRNKGFEHTMGQFLPGETARALLKPYGVWAVVAPFNFPLAIAAGMSTGAVITGNTAVFKPASDTPYMGLRLNEVLHDAGLPPGVFNYVTGPGSTIGQELVDNADIDGFVFTGSRAVGLRAYRAFSDSRPKPIITELGGKNPTIVAASAEVEKSALGVMRGAFGYGGQKCSACSRVLVDRRVKEAFVQRLVAETQKLKVGDPTVRDVYLGPVINDAAVTTFKKAVTEAEGAGGKILVGGKVLNRDGYFVEPTIVDGLPRTHRINKEELFVPILSIVEVNGLDDAIRAANDVDYGLTAGIFTREPSEIRRFFTEVEAGVLYANRTAGATTGAVVGVQPFGGWKMSGITGKSAGGHYYLPQFMREQSQSEYV